MSDVFIVRSIGENSYGKPSIGIISFDNFSSENTKSPMSLCYAPRVAPFNLHLAMAETHILYHNSRCISRIADVLVGC